MALADPSALELCQRTGAETRGLCGFVHILARIARDCMMQSDAPDPFMHFMIGGKARDLLALLPELKKALNGVPGSGKDMNEPPRPFH